MHQGETHSVKSANTDNSSSSSRQSSYIHNQLPITTEAFNFRVIGLVETNRGTFRYPNTFLNKTSSLVLQSNKVQDIWNRIPDVFRNWEGMTSLYQTYLDLFHNFLLIGRLPFRGSGLTPRIIGNRLCIIKHLCLIILFPIHYYNIQLKKNTFTKKKPKAFTP